MANQDEQVEQEKIALGSLMSNKLFRTFIRYQVLEPCGFFTKKNVQDQAHNAKMIALHDLAQDIVENMKFANLEAYFEMIREQVLEDEEEGKE